MGKGNDKHTVDATSEVVRVMLRTLLSTTLRIFIPTTVFFVIGFIVDRNCETRPWGMIIGALVGIAMAIWLVVLQLKKIQEETKKTKGKAKNGSKHQS